MSSRIEVSKDVTSLVKGWLHSSTSENDTIKLPSPPRLTLWPDRQGIGSPAVTTPAINEVRQKRQSLATKLKKRLVVAKRKRESLLMSESRPESTLDSSGHVEESKCNVMSLTRKRNHASMMSPTNITTLNCNKKRKGNIGSQSVVVTPKDMSRVGDSLLPNKGHQNGFSGHEVTVMNGQSLLKPHVRRSKRGKKNFKKK